MEAKDHAIRIKDALDRYSLLNHRPAIDEPANDFERAVNYHYELQALLKEAKGLLKSLETDERKARDGIAASLIAFFGPKLKEGTNTYEMSNGRMLKFNNKLTRSIDQSMVEQARAKYEDASDVPAGLAFDSLLRTKYELDKKAWNKLLAGGEAATAVALCITTKNAAPEIEVD